MTIPTSVTTSTQPTFSRDRLTWLAYTMLAYMGFYAAIMGPVMPYLRAELNLNYTEGGLHTSGMAVGMIAAGLTGERMAQRLGRKRLLWGGACLEMLGALLLIGARVPALTATGVILMGLCGGWVMITVNTTLSDRHGERRAVALAEANIAASLAGTLGPLLVGGFQRAGLSWRFGLVAAMALMPLVALIFRKVAVPNSAARTEQHAAGRLPARFWGYWGLVWLVVSVEWCMIVWSPDFLEKVAGIPRALAAAAVFVFYLAQLSGRVTGSLLARRLSGRVVLLLSLAVSAAGFPLFWLARIPALNVIGLFVAGFGVANLFPFTMAASLAAAPGRTDLAASRVSLGAGIAIFSSPLLLAWLADRAGINAAYGIVPLLLGLSLAVLLLASRARGEA